MGGARELAPRAKLEAIDAWLGYRRDATISVGVVSSDVTRRCTVHAHSQTFSATRRGDNFETSWQAIVAALGLCELFEAAQFGEPG